MGKKNTNAATSAVVSGPAADDVLAVLAVLRRHFGSAYSVVSEYGHVAEVHVFAETRSCPKRHAGRRDGLDRDCGRRWSGRAQ